MKQFIVVLFLLLSFHSNACMHALQNRIFPLAYCNKGWAVLEAYMQRTDWRTNENAKVRTAWYGKCYYKIYNQAGVEVYSQLIDSLQKFSQEEYEKILQNCFNKAMNLAKNQTGFIKAKPLYIGFCDYANQCTKAKLIFDTIKNKVWIQLFNGNKSEVTFINKPVSEVKKLFEGYYGENESGIFLVADLQGGLRVNSVRIFTAGNKKITLAHLGDGQRMMLADDTIEEGKEYESPFIFNDINKSIYREPMLHHGRGFDFFVTEEIKP